MKSSQIASAVEIGGLRAQQRADNKRPLINDQWQLAATWRHRDAAPPRPGLAWPSPALLKVNRAASRKTISELLLWQRRRFIASLSCQACVCQHQYASLPVRPPDHSRAREWRCFLSVRKQSDGSETVTVLTCINRMVARGPDICPHSSGWGSFSRTISCRMGTGWRSPVAPVGPLT